MILFVVEYCPDRDGVWFPYEINGSSVCKEICYRILEQDFADYNHFRKDFHMSPLGRRWFRVSVYDIVTSSRVKAGNVGDYSIKRLAK